MARLLFLLLVSCALILGLPAKDCAASEPPVSDTLSGLYAEVLKNPADTKVNLRYARLAEVEGQLRLALAAYERVILNDPNNREAQAGFARLRRRLEPSLTQFRLEIGSGYDSNPRNLHEGETGKPVFFANMSLRDERSIRGLRWRTLANMAADYPLDVGELLYGYVGLQTGPLFELNPVLALHPALGTAVATLEKRFFYVEANASLTFEGRFGGGFQALRLRGGHRSYGSVFTADEGYFADAVGQVTFPVAFIRRGSIEIAPWARWSGVSGTVRNDLNEEFTPGRYAEWGLELGYYTKPMADLTLGISVIARERWFMETRVNGERREDIELAPGLRATRSNLFSCACDVLLDYRYRVNFSNDPLSRYQGHRVALSFATRF